MAREFGASNEPGTCIWCGRKLHWVYTAVVRKAEPLAKPVCRECKSSEHVTKDDGYWYCTACQSGNIKTHVNKIISRRKLYDKPGDGGSGLFDTGSCAESFGRAAAYSGFRFKPAKIPAPADYAAVTGSTK